MGVNMYYKPKDFELDELYPKDFYERIIKEKNGEAKLWQLWDYEMLYTAQHLRDRYGTMSINNWHDGGDRQYCGWRPMDCKVGALLSDHKAWKGLDLHPAGISAIDIRTQILSDPYHEDFKFITCLEMDISWLHVSTRNWQKEIYGIQKVYP